MSDANLTAKVSIEGIDSSISSMDKMTTVAKSLEKATASLENAIQNLGQSKKATAQIVDDFGNVVQSSSKKVSSAKDANDKAANSYKGVGGAIRNTSYQVQDFATQVAGGTSAVVALGQQLPQLLSGFGLMGVLAGTAVAVIIPLVNALGLFKTASEKATDSIKTTNGILKGVKDSLDLFTESTELLTQKSANAFQGWVKAFKNASAEVKAIMKEQLAYDKYQTDKELEELDKRIAKYDEAKKIMQKENLTSPMALPMLSGGTFGSGYALGTTDQEAWALKIKRSQLGVKQTGLQNLIGGNFAAATAESDKNISLADSINQKSKALEAEAKFYGVSNAEKEKGVLLAQFELTAVKDGLNFSKDSLATKRLMAAVDAKHAAEQEKKIQDYIKEADTVQKLADAESKRLTMSTREYEKYIEQIKLEGDIAKATVGWNDDKKQSYIDVANVKLKEKQATDDLNYANNRTFGTGAISAMKSYVEEASNLASQVNSAFTNAFKGMEDALLSFVSTGKISFRSLTISILNDMARMAIRAGITAPLMAIAQGAIGGMLSPSSSVSLGSGASGASLGGVGTSTSSGFGIRGYATGTNYVPNDQIALLHEGEAVVPKKYNPSAGGFGGSGSNVVTVNVNMQTGVVDATSNANDAKQLGIMISNVVKGELIKQQRPGGILSGA